jgi:hypothetical protein
MEYVGLSVLARLVTTHDVPGLLAQLIQVDRVYWHLVTTHDVAGLLAQLIQVDRVYWHAWSLHMMYRACWRS